MTFDLERLANAAKGKNAADLYLTYEGELFTYAELSWCDWIVTWIRDCFTDYKIANICHVFQKALLQYYSQKSSLPPAQIIAKRAGLEVFVKIFDANKAAFEKYASSDLQAAANQYGTIEKNTPTAVAPREEKKADVKESKDALERYANLVREKGDLERANVNLIQDNVRLGDRVANLETRAQRAEAQVTELNEAAAKRIAEQDHPPPKQLPQEPNIIRDGQIDKIVNARVQEETQHVLKEMQERSHAQIEELQAQKAEADRANGVLREDFNRLHKLVQDAGGARKLEGINEKLARLETLVEENAKLKGAISILEKELHAKAEHPANSDIVQPKEKFAAPIRDPRERQPQNAQRNLALEEENMRLKADVEQLKAQIIEINGRANAPKIDLAEVAKARHAEQIKLLTEDNTAMKERIGTLEAALKRAEEAPKEKPTEVARLQKHNRVIANAYRTILPEKDKQIQALRQQLSELHAQYTWLQNATKESWNDNKEETVQTDTEFDVSGKGEFDET